MSRVLTNPKVPSQANNAVGQNIARFFVDFGFESNPTGDGVSLNLAKTALNYSVSDVDATGKLIWLEKQSVFHAGWTPELVDAVRIIIEFSETHAEGKGLMAAGVSKTDI